MAKEYRIPMKFNVFLWKSFVLVLLMLLACYFIIEGILEYKNTLDILQLSIGLSILGVTFFHFVRYVGSLFCYRKAVLVIGPEGVRSPILWPSRIYWHEIESCKLLAIHNYAAVPPWSLIIPSSKSYEVLKFTRTSDQDVSWFKKTFFPTEIKLSDIQIEKKELVKMLKNFTDVKIAV